MSHPEFPEPQPPAPEPAVPQATTPQPSAPKAGSGHGLLSFAILVAGLGGGLLAWHPWVTPPAPEPPKDPGHIKIQQVGDQYDVTDSSSTEKPVYCMTNETGALYCMVLPNRNTMIRPSK
ncbi:hypothetical protein AB5J62_18795 [Amycolatopsis sp. cg5]|uniref:hypothetical protein n=1 Tax=Amycolatopsis sp. cg5 TaxID=3238802 RepID=UPI003524B796